MSQELYRQQSTTEVSNPQKQLNYPSRSPTHVSILQCFTLLMRNESTCKGAEQKENNQGFQLNLHFTLSEHALDQKNHTVNQRWHADQKQLLLTAYQLSAHCSTYQKARHRHEFGMSAESQNESQIKGKNQTKPPHNHTHEPQPLGKKQMWGGVQKVFHQ